MSGTMEFRGMTGEIVVVNKVGLFQEAGSKAVWTKEGVCYPNAWEYQRELRLAKLADEARYTKRQKEMAKDKGRTKGSRHEAPREEWGKYMAG